MRFLILCLLLSGPAFAAPFSENLMACRAHVLWLGQHISDPQAADALQRYGARLWDAAQELADAEGTSATVLARAGQEKAAEWAVHGKLWIFTQEARDWSDYCKAFGAHLGIDRSDLRAAFASQ